MMDNDNLPGIMDRQDEGAIVRAIEENTRVLLAIKAAIEALARTGAPATREAENASAAADRTAAEAAEVYKACPSAGLFKRADVISAMDPGAPVLADPRRLSAILKGLVGVELLTGCGKMGAAKYQKVPGIDEATALERIGSKAFRAAMNHKGEL